MDRLVDIVHGTDGWSALSRLLHQGERQITVSGLAGSSLPLLAAALWEGKNQIVMIVEDADTAGRVTDDLSAVMDGSAVHLLTLRRPSATAALESSVSRDTAAIHALSFGSKSLFVCTPAVMFARLPAAEWVLRSALSIESGEHRPLSSLVTFLNECGFQRDDFVRTPGEYAVRGGILDAFPFAAANPVRMEFAGERIESMREFDPLSQRSIRDLQKALIVPDLFTDSQNNTGVLTDLLQPDAVVLMVEPGLIASRIEEMDEQHDAADLLKYAGQFRTISAVSISTSGDGVIDFNIASQPSFNGSIAHLGRVVAELHEKGIVVYLSCEGHAEQARLKDLFKEIPRADNSEGMGSRLDEVRFIHEGIHEGFIAPAAKTAVFTEHQIFGRVKRRRKRGRSHIRRFDQHDINRLTRGDFVVHMDYGVGVYGGLQKITVKHIEQEVVRLAYAENDTLYVNLNYLNRLQKYSSKEGYVPKLHRLGSPDWDKLKTTTRKRIQDIARDLIRLYAQRKISDGFASSPDTPWQHELEASFMYEDTFDQAKATREVKSDMEAPHPMDRLICGDVGFGKTEVAVRAAFKAVMSGKQVAVLVPTTILALQHHRTFLDRLARYGTRVAVVSRFKSKKELQQTITDLSTGAVDIVIGTHRILSTDIRFKSLGLLIIDEEHRFGVTAKEKLRYARTNVDTLTLTATPIPRTLHFSLLGARDLSIIATPPRNRLPVDTEIITFDADRIRDAMVREAQRGGQIYFVHDRISNIAEMTERIGSMVPGLRVHFAHGQMNAHELENVMVDFFERRFDVLVCTKIIESGLDVPNVNTMIINRADRFGMAELYQLRGRVGRSNQQAYAYLIVPPLTSLPKATISRLQAVEEHTHLGAGFHLAMRDLEIRGAGDLLGAQQSGFIEAIGFETYTRILEEAVADLKATEFNELFKEKGDDVLRSDAVVDVDVSALIPDGYVENPTERLALYRQLYGVRTAEQLKEVLEEMRDRFGALPDEVENLRFAIEIKLAASRLGFTRVALEGNRVEVELPPESDSRFYEGETLQAIMENVSRLREYSSRMKQDGKVLRLIASVPDDGKPVSRIVTFLEEVTRVQVSAS